MCRGGGASRGSPPPSSAIPASSCTRRGIDFDARDGEAPHHGTLLAVFADLIGGGGGGALTTVDDVMEFPHTFHLFTLTQPSGQIGRVMWGARGRCDANMKEGKEGENGKNGKRR